MDLVIRQQLSAAQNHQDIQALKNTYELIKSVNQGKSALDSSESFSSDLYVLCAEQALQEKFENFVMYLMKALDFAIHDPRYYFLIYNASVLYWQVVRPYLKPGFRYLLIPSLSQIVTALNQAEEQDKQWRAELMIELLECFLDASKIKEAVDFSSTAAAFIKNNVPDKYQHMFSLMVHHKLMNASQIEEDIQSSISLSVIYKIQTIKSQLDTNEFPREATTSLNTVFEFLKQYDEDSSISVLDEKIPLLLELARLSLKLNCIQLAFDCIHDLKQAGIKAPGKLIEIECLECEYEVHKLGTKIATYTKGVVETQLKVIRRLEQALQHAVRLGDPNVIQVVCATQWNLCLPLLQHNLHQHVRKPLISVADSLEKIDSLLILLRCQVHMEIARIEEDEDRIEAAMEHFQKAIYLDNNGQYQEHLKMAFHRLHLCTMLYKSPERLEDQAIIMIEQAKKGKQKDSVRKKRSLLVNAGLALAPDAFQIVLDSENEAKVSSGKSRSQISYLCAKAQHHTKSVEKTNGHLKRLGHGNDKESIWVDHLSQYAMENFLRAAEMGEELNEAWIVHNTVVYVLNHNKHLIASGRQREIVESLQSLLSAIKNTGHSGNTVVLVMLCNALARGLILCWIPKSVLKTDEKKKIDAATDKSKRSSIKGLEKTNSVQPLSVDPNGLPDIKAALEVCEFALNLTNRNIPNELVPIAVRQQIIATWVKAKQLLQQQIGHKLGTDDELVKMTLECNWSDPLVELQTLTRLTHFAYASHDHEIVMTCSQRTLQLDDAVLYDTDVKKHEMDDYTARQEMLSTAVCIQGRSIMENLAGKKHLRLAASKAFVQSARYAGETGNCTLVMLAARHFWNACLPFIGSSLDREQLKEPTETILKNIIKAESKIKQEKSSGWRAQGTHTPDWNGHKQDILKNNTLREGTEEDLTLRTSLYGLLFHMYADKRDWETGLKVLDEAIQVLPRTKHRLLIFKHMVIVKARLGRNFMMDIQKFKDESEDYLSHMWHRLAPISKDIVGQLTCYQNAIEALQKQESEWQKVDYLMEFAEWLYCNKFPLNDAIKHLDWAVDILLHLKLAKGPLEEEEKNIKQEIPSPAKLKVDFGVNVTIPQTANEDLKNIRQLETLFRAHTLMAIISGHSSPYHQQHCLMAYANIIRIWQVSLSAAGSIIKALPKSSPSSQNAQSATPKKDKGKKDAKQTPKSTTLKKNQAQKNAKQVQSSVMKEKPKRKGPVEALPASVEEWASYDCPDEVRDAFKQETSCYVINRDNILVPILELDAVTGKGLSGLSFPYLWIDKAEVLIQLGLYQPARLLLSEAHSATQEMNDIHAVSRCLYLLAVLANLEKNHGQAKALLEKAQLIGGNEQFWYNSTLSLIQAVLEEDKEGKERVACKILQKTVKVFRSTLEERPNRKSDLGFIIASLEARRTLIQIKYAQNFMKVNAESSQLSSMLQESYDELIQIEEDFLRYGYKDHSAEILLERANIHRTIATHTEDEEEKHSCYLDAYKLAQRAVYKEEEVFNNIWSLLPLHEIRNISMPLMRRLANLKLSFVEINLDILHLVNAEKKRKELREGSLNQVVEEFVRLTPDSASVEQGWIDIGRTVGHVALAQLASLQSLYTGCPDIKAKYLYLTGKTLRLLAVNVDPLNSDIYWNETVTEETPLNTMKPPITKAECNEHEMKSSSSPISKNQHDEQRKKANELKRKRILAQRYLSQSSEVLLQCMNVAFSNNIIDILAAASLEIIECIGRFDPVSSSQFLALHQSCSSSMMMKDILLAATSNTSSSQLAALLHLQHHLKQKGDITSNLLKNVEQRLTATSKNLTENINENEKNFTSDFCDILKAMEEYLKPVLPVFDFTDFRQQSPSVSTAESGKTKAKDKETKHTGLQGGLTDLGDCVILLADKLLMELPLEALSIFQEEAISSVSRDFSLQILYNRIHVEEPENEVKKDPKSTKEPKPKVDQKKNVKMVPINRILPPNCLSADTHNFKYVVDPYNEAKEAECQLMILLDLMQSNQSFQRLAKLDTLKSRLHISVERPTETAILLSLTGVRSIMANQWYTPLQENAKRLEILSENLLQTGKTTGQTIRVLQKYTIGVEKSPTGVEENSKNSSSDEIENQIIPNQSNLPAIQPSSFNCVLYGLPNIIVT
ncbi:TPR repeat-containing protein C10orf93 [Chelonia mydas]|uniref:TPR repeat-containing protein C10orf93 n=1 Tax=Chelonia mydas TaxID=8469 RepID=M7BWD6_CHEMY|nr:TPR repeat-containing protein C10orf93 [Chelonia mydas]